MGIPPGDSLSYLGPNVLELCSMADITFMALHGSLGENGKLQSAFDILGIRYTGPNSLGCALSMDKGVTKEIFQAQGVQHQPVHICSARTKTARWMNWDSIFR